MSAPRLPILAKLHEEGLGYGIGPALVCQEAEQIIRGLYEALEAARKGLCCPTCLDWCDKNPVCKQIDAALASAMSASGQDPKGLEAKPASAVPQADAPTPTVSQ